MNSSLTLTPSARSCAKRRWCGSLGCRPQTRHGCEATNRRCDLSRRRLGSGKTRTLLSILSGEGDPERAAVLVILAPGITACARVDIDDGHSNARAGELASYHQGEIRSASLRQHRPQASATTGFLMCGFVGRAQVRMVCQRGKGPLGGVRLGGLQGDIVDFAGRGPRRPTGWLGSRRPSARCANFKAPNVR